MKIEELDALYEAAGAKPWRHADGKLFDGKNGWVAEGMLRDDPDGHLVVALVNAWPELRERLRRAERLADAAISACECQGGLGDDAAMDGLRAALCDFGAPAGHVFKAGDRVEVSSAGGFWQPAAVAPSQPGPRIIVHLDGERMPREVDAASVRRAALTSEPSR